MRIVKKNNRIKLYIVLSLIIILIVSLSIGYAVLSTTLNISGNSYIESSEWNISLERTNISNVVPAFGFDTPTYAIGTGVVLNEGTITNTSFKNFAMSVTKPGDGVMLALVIKNNGTIPAVSLPGSGSDIIFTSSTNNSADVALAKKNVQFFGAAFVNKNGSIASVGDVLCPGKEWGILISMEYLNEATELLSSTVSTNLSFEVNFEQGDKSLCN